MKFAPEYVTNVLNDNFEDAKALFLETFTAIRTNFTSVFQTLFGGGECDLRLSDPDDPLEAEGGALVVSNHSGTVPLDGLMTGSTRVLIVEDDPSTRSGLAELVQAWGFYTDQAQDGEEAMRKITTFRPAIIVSDLVMPRMGGRDLLRALHDQLSDITFILLTAQGTVESAVEAIKDGAYDQADGLITQAERTGVKYDPLTARFVDTPEKMRKLLADERTKGFDVNVDTMKGVVTLRGGADSQAAKQAAQELETFEKIWGAKYPSIAPAWRRASGRSGASSKMPASGVSNSEQKIDGLSNSGQQKKSTLPRSLTSAAVRMSPMMPWFSIGLWVS